MATSTSLAPPRTGGRALDVSLWAAQFLIALSFCVGGIMKMAMDLHQLAAVWSWTGDLNPTVVRILGVIDFAGGVGVLLPALTRIKPGLTVIAALGCVVLQMCAIVFHFSRGEIIPALPVNAVLVSLSAFILWGRWKRPITPRNQQSSDGARASKS